MHILGLVWSYAADGALRDWEDCSCRASRSLQLVASCPSTNWGCDAQGAVSSKGRPQKGCQKFEEARVLLPSSYWRSDHMANNAGRTEYSA